MDSKWKDKPLPYEGDGKDSDMKREKSFIVGTGVIIGAISTLLVLFGNPANMGFCIACFLRDTAGALGFHNAGIVQYIRPEIIGLVLGSAVIATVKKEYAAKGGSSPLTRFVLGIFEMIGCLMFLGCPFRMILRLAGGDFNALLGLVGFVGGILTGVFFLNKGYSLKRNYKLPASEGRIFSIVMLILLVLLVAAPEFIAFSEEGPGSKHAFWAISLAAGIIVGILAQRTRLCMVGGIRDLVLFKENKLILGFIAVFVSALACNLILNAVADGTFFKLGFADQAVAHTDGLWNALGMYLAGFGCVLLGGCPLRQLVLSGEGNSDSAITVLGLITGAAIAHNFGLASSGKGPTANGKIAVAVGIAAVLLIACVNTFAKKGEQK